MSVICRFWAAGLALWLFACGTAVALQSVSPAVQVAISYGPRKSALISGVIVGDGNLVLTQANLLLGAEEIVVALTDNQILDAVVERLDTRRNVALLRLAKPVSAPLALMEAMPPGNVVALVVGAPESFRTRKLNVELQPAGDRPAWTVVPAVPPEFRGAPILSVSGTLLGIVIEKQPGDFPQGVPITEVKQMIAGEDGGTRADDRAPVPARPAVERKEADAEKAEAPPAPKPQAPAPKPQAASKPADQPAAAQQPSPETKQTAGGERPERIAGEAAKRRSEARPSGSASPGPDAPGTRSLTATPPRWEARGGDPVVAPRTDGRAEKATGQPPASKPTREGTVISPAEKAAARTEAPVTSPAAARPSGETEPAPPATVDRPATAAPSKGAQQETPPPDSDSGSATDQWKRRIALEPKNLQLRFAFAKALITGGLYSEAVAVLEEARAAFPSQAEVYWELGQAYWQQGVHKRDGTPRRDMDRVAYRKCVLALDTFVERAPQDPRADEARNLLSALRKAGQR